MLIRDTADDVLLRDALLENLHREDLNPLEEAAAYEQLLEDFGATHEQLGQRIGRSRSQVTNTIRLLNLPAPVQRRVAAKVLSAGHARALLALSDAEVQETLAARIVAEGLSVRATEELVALGGRAGAGRSARSRRPQMHSPALATLADRLSDRFDTRVTVELGRRKGKVTVEFASVDDLERIIAVLAPDDPGLAASIGGAAPDDDQENAHTPESGHSAELDGYHTAADEDSDAPAGPVGEQATTAAASVDLAGPADAEVNHTGHAYAG